MHLSRYQMYFSFQSIRVSDFSRLRRHLGHHYSQQIFVFKLLILIFVFFAFFYYPLPRLKNKCSLFPTFHYCFISKAIQLLSFFWINYLQVLSRLQFWLSWQLSLPFSFPSLLLIRPIEFSKVLLSFWAHHHSNRSHRRPLIQIL